MSNIFISELKANFAHNLLPRYEDEINKRTECENDFVLIKKVSYLSFYPISFSGFVLLSSCHLVNMWIVDVPLRMWTRPT